MRSEFEVAFNEITEMRSLPREVVIEALQNALVSAYRRDAGASSAQRVEAVPRDRYDQQLDMIVTEKGRM